MNYAARIGLLLVSSAHLLGLGAVAFARILNYWNLLGWHD